MSDFDPWRSALAASQVMVMSHAPPALLARTQRERLQQLLTHARSHTRLHAERLKALPEDAPLEALPVMHKAELMARFDDSVTDSRVTLAGLRRFTADPAGIGRPWLDDYLVWESSGSTGEPAAFVQDSGALAVYDALETLRPAARQGLGDHWAFVGVTDGHFASQASAVRLRRINPWMAGATRSLSLMQPLPALLAELEAWAPTVLATYPSAALLLADELAAGRLPAPIGQRLRAVHTGGETLLPAARQRLAEVFQCPVHNHYGASEFLSIACECRLGGLHLNADWVILEPVDAKGRPVPPGTLSHDVLLTNLANRVQPLIRYALGDRIRLPADRCGCGSPLPLIEVHGRDEQPLRLRGRNGRTVSLLPLALTTVMEEEARVFDFQLVQRDDHTVVLRLADDAGPSGGKSPRGGNGESLTARTQRCHAALHAFAKSQGVDRMRLIDEPVSAIARGRSGKLLRVIAAATPRAGGPARRAPTRPENGGRTAARTNGRSPVASD
jgi:phenylacetate-CoA ligase